MIRYTLFLAILVVAISETRQETLHGKESHGSRILNTSSNAGSERGAILSDHEMHMHDILAFTSDSSSRSIKTRKLDGEESSSASPVPTTPVPATTPAPSPSSTSESESPGVNGLTPSPSESAASTSETTTFEPTVNVDESTDEPTVDSTIAPSIEQTNEPTNEPTMEKDDEDSGNDSDTEGGNDSDPDENDYNKIDPNPVADTNYGTRFSITALIIFMVCLLVYVVKRSSQRTSQMYGDNGMHNSLDDMEFDSQQLELTPSGDSSTTPSQRRQPSYNKRDDDELI